MNWKRLVVMFLINWTAACAIAYWWNNWWLFFLLEIAIGMLYFWNKWRNRELTSERIMISALISGAILWFADWLSNWSFHDIVFVLLALASAWLIWFYESFQRDNPIAKRPDDFRQQESLK